MARLQASVSIGLLLVASACSPEVLLATNPSAGGAGGSGASLGGAGGAGAGAGAGSGTAGSASSGESGAGDMGGEAGANSAPPEPPRLLADSVADFDLVQGQHGWLYGYDDGTSANFALMNETGTITTYKPGTGDEWDCWSNTTKAHWTQIFRLGAHANGVDTSVPSAELLQRAVRRWVSTFAGDVLITGEIAKIDVTPGTNGIEASLVIDGTLKQTWFVGGEDSGGWSYKVEATVNVGSHVDFVLDPFESSDHHDLTRFTAVIARAEVSRP